MMRNNYSKFTLVEMLRGYGVNQLLDAADHIEALEARIEELTTALNDASNSFDRITELRWGYDGDCGATNIAELAVDELKAELNNHDYKLGKTVNSMQAKVAELEAKLLNETARAEHYKRNWLEALEAEGE